MASRILIADDHEALRKALRYTIERHEGWRVCAEASNGFEAAERAAECNPDVVILDLSMPEMNGLQAAQRIHSEEPDVPIVLYTVYRFPALERQAQACGVRRVVDKAGAIGELISAVETALAESGQPGGRAKAVGEA